MGYQGKAQRARRAVAVAAVMAVTSSVAAQALDAGSLLSPILGPAATAGVAPFAAPGGGYAAFATGTVLHAGLAGAVAGLDFVSSTAAATSAPTTAPTPSELGRVALPVLPAKGSYAQGVGLGLDVGLVPGLSTGLFGNAKAVAPPSSAPVEQDAAPISLAPLVSLTPFRAGAQALSSAAACVLGSTLASGRGEAADLALGGQSGLHGLSIGAGPAAGPAGSALSRSESRTAIVPGSEAGRLGVMAETTETLGPLTLLTGTANQTTVDLRGTWALRVSADGKVGRVSYGPQNLADGDAAIAVHNAAGAVVAQASAAQVRLAGIGGVHLAVAGVGEIVVGEQPRTRGRTIAPTALGTSTEAAVDLVRVRLLGQDVRLGHMEAAVAVPPAGVTCPGLAVSVSPDGPTAGPGSDFAVKVRVSNPNEGTVTGLTVASQMAADGGVAVGAAPAGAGNVVAPNGAAFKLATPLGPGQAIELPGRVHVDAASGPGRIRFGASATGRYGDGPLAVPAAGNGVSDGLTVTAAASTSPAGAGPQHPVGGKAPATAGAPGPAGSAGRKAPGRAAAGVSGAAGLAASAAPAAPAPSVSAPPPAPAAEPAPAAPAPPSEPAPAPAPAPAPPGPPAGGQTAAPKPRPKRESNDRGRWAWGGAAAIFLAAIAAAAVARLLGGVRSSR